MRTAKESSAHLVSEHRHGTGSDKELLRVFVKAQCPQRKGELVHELRVGLLSTATAAAAAPTGCGAALGMPQEFGQVADAPVLAKELAGVAAAEQERQRAHRCGHDFPTPSAAAPVVAAGPCRERVADPVDQRLARGGVRRHQQARQGVRRRRFAVRVRAVSAQHPHENWHVDREGAIFYFKKKKVPTT